jgi:hypothetical protein
MATNIIVNNPRVANRQHITSVTRCNVIRSRILCPFLTTDLALTEPCCFPGPNSSDDGWNRDDSSRFQPSSEASPPATLLSILIRRHVNKRGEFRSESPPGEYQRNLRIICTRHKGRCSRDPKFLDGVNDGKHMRCIENTTKTITRIRS